MTSEPTKKLDSYFMNLSTHSNFRNFMNGFFGQDPVWVKNTLKAVLPENIPDEVLTKAAASLNSYKTESVFYKSETDVDIFFRELYDK